MSGVIRYISLFSGIECVSVAAIPLGWEPICFSEIEPFPSAVLAHHYPDVPNVGDMTVHDWTQYRGRCDVVVGGSPCQAFSVAGRRESLDDDRGNLTLRFVEAVNDIAPAFVIWENVPGVLSTTDNAFGCFLAALAGDDSPLEPGPRPRHGRSSSHWTWEKDAGMHRPKWPFAGVVDGPERAIAWRVLDAQYFGLAQRRERVFLVACPRSGGFHPEAVLFESAGVRRDSPPRRRAPEDVAGTIEASSGHSRGAGTSPGVITPIAPAISSAVTSKWAKGTGGPSGDECQNLVANPISPSLTANPYGDHESRQGLLVAHTLRGDGFNASEDGTGRGTPLVVAFHGSQDPDASGEVTHPVGRNQGQETCIAFRSDDGKSAMSLALRGRDGRNMPEVGGPLAHALRSSGGGSDKPFVLAFQDRFRGDDGRGYDRAPNAIANQVGALETVKRWHIALEWLVRRLTPRECERLQGLPDDYTLLTNWNGWRYVEEGEDPEELRSQGFQLRQTKKTKRWRVNDPDGPRYKAIGNGMARPCIGWVLTQVHKAWCEYYGVASAAEQRIASNLS